MKGMLLYKLSFFLLLVILLLKFIPSQESNNNAINEILSISGFPYEQHNVVTPDGYNLSLTRIVSENTTKLPVLIFHGLFNSGIDFIILKEKSLGFFLAKKGYDVWIATFRGSGSSKNHVKLDPENDAEFWDYSYNEIALYDVPTLIDYVLTETSKPQLNVIGFSLGAGATFMAFHDYPELNKKIKLITCLAPVIILDEVDDCHICYYINSFGKQLQYYVKVTKPAEFMKTVYFFINAFKYAIKFPILSRLADLPFNVIQGSIGRLNRSLLEEVLEHLPSSISIKSFAHLQQIYAFTYPKKFDYGSAKNLQVYGTEESPSYNMSLVTSPTVIFWGRKDPFCYDKIVQMITKQLPNVIKTREDPDLQFTHMDFLYGNQNLETFEEIIKEL